MGKILYEDCCRVCLEEDFKGRSLFELYDNKYLPDIIFAITGIEIIEDNILPKNICFKCISMLLDAQRIRILCIESNKYLERHVIPKEEITENSREFENLIVKDDDDIIWSEYIVKEDCSNDYMEVLEEHVLGETELIEEGDNANDGMDRCTELVESVDDEEIVLNDSSNEEGNNDCETKSSTESNGDVLQSIDENSKQNLINCPICPKRFTRLANLKRHLPSHNKTDDLTCDKCGKVFTEAKLLYSHFKVHKKYSTEEDREEYIIECELCHDTTTSLAVHNAHMKTIHNIEKTKPFKCSYCAMKFTSKQNMNRHVKNMHIEDRDKLKNRDKNWLCNTCGTKFFTNFHLQVHIRSHTGEKPYKCEFCGKAFSQIAGLKMHKFLHTGEKPFACATCGKTFTQRGHVRQHALTHADIKAHECNICHRSFKVKCNLTAHMAIHTGNKTHICKECGKSFIQSTKLRAHIQKHHSNLSQKST